LHRSLREDLFDRQPERSADGRFMLAADVRLDNRDELIDALGMVPGDYAKASDSRVLFDLLIAKRERALDQLLGDFAFAWWDGRAQILTLARDPLGERPLHYTLTPHGVMFASMPQALAHFADAEVDDDRLASLAGDLPAAFRGSFFRGVEKIEPGQAVSISSDGATVRRYWDPLQVPAIKIGAGELGEAMRAQIDAAVARRLRRATGGVASHLSSGVDSSAVASSAALALACSGQTVQAFTSAPLRPLTQTLPGWHADESAIASQTAQLHANIEHHVVRQWAPLLDLGPDHRLAGQPVGAVLNNAWWSEINARARKQGATVLLTGEAGNFTISAGLGWDDLTDLLRRRRLGRWWAEIRAHPANQGGWGAALRASLAPLLPAPLAAALAVLRGHSELERQSFVGKRYRDKLEREVIRDDWESLSRLTGRRRRVAFLRLVDPGAFRKRSLARWGIEERDATADRRLVEFCLSLPVEARLDKGVRRPVLQRALAGRVAPSVLREATRGLQSADWQTRISRDGLEDFVASVRSGCTEDLLDWDAVDANVRAWPPTATGDARAMYRFSSLLRALAAAHFRQAFN
jgi:asparagine synthase (glutamine-hydrolysing)